MAHSLLPKCSACTIFLFSFFFLVAVAVDAKLVHSQGVLHRPPKEKTSHLHFYFHDMVNGQNQTVVCLAGAGDWASATGFGDVVMNDDPLTEGPELSSKLVGRAQALYASVGLQETSLLMAVNYVFREGKYNGSSLSILGRNTAMRPPVREMVVVGGSCLFRIARGYAIARTHRFDANMTTIEYNVYVVLYELIRRGHMAAMEYIPIFFLSFKVPVTAAAPLQPSAFKVPVIAAAPLQPSRFLLQWQLRFSLQHSRFLSQPTAPLQPSRFLPVPAAIRGEDIEDIEILRDIFRIFPTYRDRQSSDNVPVGVHSSNETPMDSQDTKNEGVSIDAQEARVIGAKRSRAKTYTIQNDFDEVDDESSEYVSLE
ncbi:uncharacterized protein LOC116253914 [Nymphaea colorata]|nr:uncharacterized protein LOC116253914 [Nymphaea colorata]